MAKDLVIRECWLNRGGEGRGDGISGPREKQDYHQLIQCKTYETQYVTSSGARTKTVRRFDFKSEADSHHDMESDQRVKVNANSNHHSRDAPNAELQYEYNNENLEEVELNNHTECKNGIIDESETILIK